MFDGNFRNGVDRFTKPIGTGCAKAGITADVLTACGVVASLGCSVAIATGHLWVGFGLLVVAALPDLLDGPVAKASGTASIRGAFFDSVADRITDTLVLCGIAWYLLGQSFATNQSKAAAILPIALLGASQLISYMRAKAEIHGFDAKGGLMERAERIVCLCVALVFNQWLVPILAIMLALTLVTAVQRFIKVWKQATDENPVLAARLAARRATRPYVFRTMFMPHETDAQREGANARMREWAAMHRRKQRASVDNASGNSATNNNATNNNEHK